MKRELVCISCPVGCRLEAERNDDGSLTVTGNQCPKGEEWAREEINAPKRVVTTTVAVDAGGRGKNDRSRVPVRTDKPLPVESIAPLLQKLHSMTVQAPVRLGDIILGDFEGTGVNVTASLSLDVKQADR